MPPAGVASPCGLCFLTAWAAGGSCTAFHSLVLGVTWKPSHHQSPRPSPRTGWGGTSVSRAWRNACGWRAWVQPPWRMASHTSLWVRLGGLSRNQTLLCFFQQCLRLSTGPSLPALGLLLHPTRLWDQVRRMLSSFLLSSPPPLFFSFFFFLTQNVLSQLLIRFLLPPWQNRGLRLGRDHPGQVTDLTSLSFKSLISLMKKMITQPLEDPVRKSVWKFLLNFFF